MILMATFQGLLNAERKEVKFMRKSLKALLVLAIVVAMTIAATLPAIAMADGFCP